MRMFISNRLPAYTKGLENYHSVVYWSPFTPQFLCACSQCTGIDEQENVDIFATIVGNMVTTHIRLLPKLASEGVFPLSQENRSLILNLSFAGIAARVFVSCLAILSQPYRELLLKPVVPVDDTGGRIKRPPCATIKTRLENVPCCCRRNTQLFVQILRRDALIYRRLRLTNKLIGNNFSSSVTCRNISRCNIVVSIT